MVNLGFPDPKTAEMPKHIVREILTISKLPHQTGFRLGTNSFRKFKQGPGSPLALEANHRRVAEAGGGTAYHSIRWGVLRTPAFRKLESLGVPGAPKDCPRDSS